VQKCEKKLKSNSHSRCYGRKYMPSFKCKDVGMNCPFEAKAKTEEELLKKIAEHASKVHNMKTISPDMMTKVKKAIKK
jgi:predicted small metal-binding protein